MSLCVVFCVVICAMQPSRCPIFLPTELDWTVQQRANQWDFTDRQRKLDLMFTRFDRNADGYLGEAETVDLLQRYGRLTVVLFLLIPALLRCRFPFACVALSSVPLSAISRDLPYCPALSVAVLLSGAECCSL